ncbi:HtaA domain-containing protein [Streptomyces sp. URMC 126]|uniref:HtaA domain-containing protein n=1 Tax=Streptomyces sp. URMC 126 TaxID=3423401 RepID=UPI003F1E244C
MAVTQRRTAFTAAVATAIALGATVLTLPARAAGEEPEAAAKSPTGFQLKDGALTWGIKESFRQYVTGDEADGTIRVADGAEQADKNGPFTFSGGKGTYDREKHTFTTAFNGSVRFLGHAKGEGKKKHWRLDLKLSDLKVTGDGKKGRVTADVTTSGKTRQDVTLATLDLAKGKPAAKSGKDGGKNGGKGGGKDTGKGGDKENAPSFAKVPATLTADGAKAFTYKGKPFFKAGTSLDRVSLTVKRGAPLPDSESKPIPEKKPTPAPTKTPTPAPKPKEPSEPKTTPKPTPPATTPAPEKTSEPEKTPAPERTSESKKTPEPEKTSDTERTPAPEETPSTDPQPAEGVEDAKVADPEDESFVPETGDRKTGGQDTGGSDGSSGTTGSTGTTGGGSETPGSTGTTGTTGSAGSPSESPKQLTADSKVYDGRLDWGVKESLRNAITTKFGGKIEVSDGAEQRSSDFRFTKATGKYKEASMLDATFDGTLRFVANPNGGKVELTLSKFRVHVEEETKGQLLAHVTKKVDGKIEDGLSDEETALADLTMNKGSLAPVNGIVTLDLVQTALTDKGAKALSIGDGKLDKGDGVDPVTAKIAVNKDAKLDDDSTGTNTDGSSPSPGTGTSGTGTGSSSGTGTGSGTDDSLAHTGSDTPTGPLAGSAAALVLAGGAAVWTARRKSAKLAG